jgi:hypothetical protein
VWGGELVDGRLVRYAVFVLVAVALALGCASRRPVGFLEMEDGQLFPLGKTGPAVVSDQNVRCSVLPYSAEMEREVFGVDLHRGAQMAVEVKIETLDENETERTFVFARHDVQGVFVDGTTRYAVDPRKVYEQNRVDKTAAMFFFGMTGYFIAQREENARRARFAASASDEFRLDRDKPSASGFLFLDIEGIADRELTALLVEYEEGVSGERWNIVIEVGSAGR